MLVRWWKPNFAAAMNKPVRIGSMLILAIGFVVPRLLRVSTTRAIASPFGIGIHNATLSIVITQTVLTNVELWFPAAVYGALMFFVTAGFGFLIRART